MAKITNSDLTDYNTWALANVSPSSDPKANDLCWKAWKYAMNLGILAGCERAAVYLEANAGAITTALDLPADVRALKND